MARGVWEMMEGGGGREGDGVGGGPGEGVNYVKSTSDAKYQES